MFAICEDAVPAPRPAADAEEPERTCALCGARLSREGQFCGWCGAPVGPEPVAQDDAHVPAGHFLG
jgi:hypothetical protein